MSFSLFFGIKNALRKYMASMFFLRAVVGGCYSTFKPGSGAPTETDPLE